MTQYQKELMDVIRYNHPEMSEEELQSAAMALYEKIVESLHREQNKK